MAEEAGVGSIEALETFRSGLILFLSKAKRCLDNGTDEVRRTREWVHGDRRAYWEQQLRARNRVLDQARQELVSARFSSFIGSPMLQMQAVRKAEAAVVHAEEKMRMVRKWKQDFDQKAMPMERRLEALRDHIVNEMPNAVHWLTRAQTTLEAYTERGSPAAPSVPPGA